MLKTNKRHEIVSFRPFYKSTFDISKNSKQYHRIVKMFVNEGKVEGKKHKSGRPCEMTNRD